MLFQPRFHERHPTRGAHISSSFSPYAPALPLPTCSFNHARFVIHNFSSSFQSPRRVDSARPPHRPLRPLDTCPLENWQYPLISFPPSPSLVARLSVVLFLRACFEVYRLNGSYRNGAQIDSPFSGCTRQCSMMIRDISQLFPPRVSTSVDVTLPTPAQF